MTNKELREKTKELESLVSQLIDEYKEREWDLKVKIEDGYNIDMERYARAFHKRGVLNNIMAMVEFDLPVEYNE